MQRQRDKADRAPTGEEERRSSKARAWLAGWRHTDPNVYLCYNLQELVSYFRNTFVQPYFVLYFVLVQLYECTSTRTVLVLPKVLVDLLGVLDLVFRII